MIEHIDGVNVDFVAQCFGIDPKKYRYNSKKETSNFDGQNDEVFIKKALLSTDTELKLKERSIAFLKVVCFHCKKDQEFPGVYQKDGKTSGLVCIHCGKKFPVEYVKNRVTLFMKQMLNLYYEGKY